MSEISLHRELRDRGYSAPELARLVRSGELSRLRRGAYALPAADGDPVAAHKARLTAVIRQVSDEAIVSHVSAAVLHGLPTWTDQLDLVHLTRDRSGGSKLRRDLRIHGLPIAPDEATRIGGFTVTSLARTVVDLSCLDTLERGVAIGDAALRLGLRDHELAAAVDAGTRRHGIGRARRVCELADIRSESVGESFSRVRFWQWGLPAPVLQLDVRDPRGVLVGRGDFGWPEFGTIGEFDGKVKYGALLKPGQSAQDVLLAEKRREERIREVGWQVVRWTWADLRRGTDLAARLQDAFRRGRDLSA